MPGPSEGALKVVLGSSMIPVDDNLARMVTRGRGSLAFILGDDACRYRLLHRHINWDRIVLAFQGSVAQGYASFKHARRGPFSPTLKAFANEFGVLRGALRFGLYTLTERREQHHAFFLHGLRVSKAYRRQGVATRLLAAIDECARASGAQHVDLEVLANNPGAHQLYVNSGFIPTRRLWLLPMKVIGMRRQVAP